MLPNNPTKNILVADDDPSIVHTIFTHFEATNQPYKLLNAPNREIALQLAKQEKLHLILLDWQMPGLNGLEVITFLQNHPDTLHIPVIIMTGVKVLDVHLEEAFNRGATDYIRKPFSKVELLARAHTAIRLLELHQREKELMQAMIAHKNRELLTITAQISQKTRYWTIFSKK